MRNLIPAIDIIKRNEGCRLKSYEDPGGVWTIGWGHVTGVYEGQVIDQASADQMLMDEIEYYADHVEHLLKVDVSNNQFCALVDFAYNLGIGALQGSTLIRLLNDQESDLRIADEFLKWVYQGRTVLPGLIKRRSEEKSLFLAPDREVA